jgi:hypothetical protein
MDFSETQASDLGSILYYYYVEKERKIKILCAAAIQPEEVNV